MKFFILAFLGTIIFASTSHSHGNHDHGGIKKLSPTIESNGTVIHLYREASCNCCMKWANIMAANGYTINDNLKEDVASIKRQEGISENLESCHTAFVDGYFIEGHVPVVSIQKVLKDLPDIAGLTVPGMPLGSPGMETAASNEELYSVLAVKTDGTTSVFDTYRGASQQ